MIVQLGERAMEGESKMKKSTQKGRRNYLAAAATAGLLAFAGGAQAEELTHFNLQHFDGIFNMTPVYVAVEEKFFEKHGLDVQLFGILAGPTAMTALISGSVDAAYNPTTYGVAFASKNPEQPILQISNDMAAPIYNVVGSNAVLDACPDATKPYPAPLNCLKGKRIGATAIGSDNFNFAVAMLKAGGMTEADAQVLALGGPVQLANALQANQTDFIVAAEPAGTQLIEVLKAGRDLYSTGADPLMADWSGQALFAKKADVEANPKKYQALVDALTDAVNFINDPANAEAVVADFGKHSPLEADLVRLMLKRHQGEFASATSCTAIDNVSKWLISVGQITEAQKLPCDAVLWKGAK
jgi:NitT/TauT family transport system substrate-binding protein